MKHTFRAISRAALAILAALTLVCPMVALAESAASSAEDIQFVTQSIIERSQGAPVSFALGEEIALPDIMSFTLTAINCYDEGDGMMSVAVHMTVTAAETNVNGLSMTDYDFMLVERPEGVSDPEAFTYSLPSAVYGRVGNHMQPFAWPVYLYPDDSVELLLMYSAPKTATQMAVVETNIMDYGEGKGLEPQGELYCYTFYRHPADFNFRNDSTQTITGLYVIPADAEGWGDNLMVKYDDPKLDAGIWMAVSFLGTEYESSTAEAWDIKVELADGKTLFFTGVPLRDIVELSFVEGVEEGRYTLSY